MTTNLSIRSSLAFAVALMSLTSGCTAVVDESDDETALGEATQAVQYGGTLSTLRESRISAFFGASDYGASGVQALGTYLYVIFDNKNQVAKIPSSLALNGTATYTPGTLADPAEQYEAITFDSHATQHFYLVQEVSSATVVQLDGSGSAQGEDYQSTNVGFGDANKGFEGLAWLRRNNDDYLLALCEGGDCGAATGTSDPGMIKVLRQTGSSWTVDTTLSVCGTGSSSCSTGFFDDYSDIALFPLGNGSYKVAITSQESKAVWIGVLSGTSWSLSAGKIYDFPSSAYCNVEGVTFLSENRLAMVSDKFKGDPTTSNCDDKDQSVHVFDVPVP